MREYRVGNVIVRYHDGELTKEEREEVIKQAAVRYFNAIEKSRSRCARPETANNI